MRFLPLQPAKVVIFVAPDANKRQTMRVYPHTTVDDVFAMLNLPGDYSYQMVNPVLASDDFTMFGLKDEIYEAMVTNTEVTIHRHPQAPPIIPKDPHAISWR